MFSSDKLYGDFEDLETGEVHEGEAEKGSDAESEDEEEEKKTDSEDYHNHTFRMILYTNSF